MAIIYLSGFLFCLLLFFDLYVSLSLPLAYKFHKGKDYIYLTHAVFWLPGTESGTQAFDEDVLKV